MSKQDLDSANQSSSSSQQEPLEDGGLFQGSLRKSDVKLNRLKSLQKILEAYDTSGEEDEGEDIETTNESHRKRKVSEQKPSDLYPLNFDGKINIDKIIFDRNFNHSTPLKAALNKEEFKDLESDELFLTDEETKSEIENFEILDDSYELEPVCHKKTRPDTESTTEEKATKNEAGEPSTSSFKVPKFRNRKFIFKPFKRDPETGKLEHVENESPISVVIPEQLAASYGLYIWPSSPVLSWYIWLRQKEFVGASVLELGAGTALPGLLAAKIGAKKVWLSDIASSDSVLKNSREAVRLNELPEERTEVIGLTWGESTPDQFKIEENSLNFILGSDLFFDPEVFEPLCVTLASLLNRHPKATALIAYQQRSEDWSVEEFLFKWGLRVRCIKPKEFLNGTDIEETDLTGKHTIYILEVHRI